MKTQEKHHNKKQARNHMNYRKVLLALFVVASSYALSACADAANGNDASSSPSVPIAPQATASHSTLPVMIVHKSPTCGCCESWVKHVRSAGFKVKINDTDKLGPIKQRVGIPYAKGSCHTAEVGGYFIEGHVPVEDIKRLLAERPDARGLTVPGMPAGSPGMELPDGRTQAYTVELVANDGTTSAYSHHGPVGGGSTEEGVPHSHAGDKDAEVHDGHELDGETQHDAAVGQQPAMQDLTAGAVPQAEAAARALHAALQSGDRNAVLELLAPEVRISEGGHTQSRDEYAAGHLNQDIAFLQDARIAPGSMRSGLRGPQAVVQSDSTISTSSKGKPVRLKSHETLRLRKQGEKWKITAIQWRASPEP